MRTAALQAGALAAASSALAAPALKYSRAALGNKFNRGHEGWCSYDYHASVTSGGNCFILATWLKRGGPDGGNCIWVDHHRWSADTPEKPLSILPLLLYRSWVDGEFVDLRGREVSVHLRGDDLELDGAKSFFWVQSGATRWHYNSRPLAISEGSWAAEPQRFVLHDDEARWHRSWTSATAKPTPLTQLLGSAQSYGFSFVGFTNEVRGRFSMAEFSISSG